jgi:antitoxin Phd
MFHISATEAKLHFGKLLDMIHREGVVIEKQGRSVAVVLSNEEYERLNNLEDAWWALKAESARQEGLLSTEESEQFLNDLLHA